MSHPGHLSTAFSALQYFHESPCFGPEHKNGPGHTSPKVGRCSKKHFSANSPLEEYQPFRPRKTTAPSDTLGKDLMPIANCPETGRQIVRSKIAKLGERFICSNASQTIVHEVKELDAAVPIRELMSNNGGSAFGNRMKNGVAVPELGRRKAVNDHRPAPHLALLDDLFCEDESPRRSRRMSPRSPLSNRSRGSRRSRRTLLSPVSASSPESPMARVLNHDLDKESVAKSDVTQRPQRRHLRHHRNYVADEQPKRRELRHYEESERPKSRTASEKGCIRCSYRSHVNYRDNI